MLTQLVVLTSKTGPDLPSEIWSKTNIPSEPVSVGSQSRGDIHGIVRPIAARSMFRVPGGSTERRGSLG